MAREKLSSSQGQLGGLLGYHLRRASAAMMADFSAQLSAVALRPVQFAILSLIADNDGITQTELCHELAVRKANMAPLIAELDRGGLLTRKPAPDDRRVQLLALTPKADAQLPAWRKLVDEQERRFLGGLSAPEHAETIRLLRKLWANGDDIRSGR
jgi:DNA-binding MarR family transcriptional regulator